MDDMYREVILEHYRHPSNYGELRDATFEAEGENPLCGDHIKVQIMLGADGETVEQVRFSGQGCAISQAAMSMLSEELVGRKVSDVERLTREDILEMMGLENLTTMRVKCAMLGLVVTRMGMHEHSGAAPPQDLDGADEFAWASDTPEV